MLFSRLPQTGLYKDVLRFLQGTIYRMVMLAERRDKEGMAAVGGCL
ncbi:hypothetical protein Barb7_02323 [Bacteroidales bacterium Barb7]|nr:hypothetical protein Barb7_02323 [Bacteroidales bacterium Barb7]